MVSESTDSLALSRSVNLWSTLKATFWCKWVELSQCRHVPIGCLACPQSAGEHQWNSSNFRNEQKVCWKHEVKGKKERKNKERNDSDGKGKRTLQEVTFIIKEKSVFNFAKCHSIWDLFSKANNCHCFIFSSLFNHLILPFHWQFQKTISSFRRKFCKNEILSRKQK